MRRFKFRFEAVLKHRAVMEDMRAHAVAAVQQELAACEARLAGLRERYERTLADRPNLLDLMEIALRESYVDSLRSRIEQEERIHEGIVARIEDARVALVAARQAREAIAKIRDRDHEKHVYLAHKAEQDRLDEIGMTRHGRDKGRDEG